MKYVLLLFTTLLTTLASAQAPVHDGEITDTGLYIGKHAWHDPGSGLPVAEVIYDPGGVLLSYKTWYEGEIMDAEIADVKRERETLPAALDRVTYADDGWGMVTYGEVGGETVVAGQKVRVAYKGWLQDGTVFEDNLEKGFKFVAGKQQVIPGFERAVMELAPGQGAYVVVPAALAYRGRAIGAIPPYAVLIYQIEVREVK